MSIKKLIKGLIVSLFLSSLLTSAGGLNKGLQALRTDDYATALSELTPKAEEGDAVAQLFLGHMYEFGMGVLQNDKTAADWYTKSAKQGIHDAQYSLGVMYENGIGVLENHRTAAGWYTKAAEQGHADAQNNLGVIYVSGKGVLENNKIAYMWFNLASYNGNEKSSASKKTIAKKMTPANISKAQEMSSRCLESNYKDC